MYLGIMKLKLCIVCLLMFIPLGIGSASVQTFESDIGTIEIDLPYTVEPGDLSNGISLFLVKPGITKPIISIVTFDASWYKDFQDYVESSIGPGHTLEKMTTDDGKPILFSVLQQGKDRDGNPMYYFRGFIDYSEEKGKYITIHAPDDVRYQGETIATYTKDQFAAICRSFAVQ
jgi:hypothetical protein